MAVRPIRLFGDPVLRTPAQPVVVDAELRRVVANLTGILLDASGRGQAEIRKPERVGAPDPAVRPGPHTTGGWAL